MRSIRIVFLLLFSLISTLTSKGLSVQVYAQAQNPAFNGVSTSSVRKIGTHLIQGSYPAQADVLNNLKSKNLPSGYPVVVMLDAENLSGYEAVLNALTDSFSPIIRVNVRATTPPGTMIGVANAIATFNNKLSTPPPVELGNEINNQTAEWQSSNYANYGQMFNTLANALGGRNPLGISAMDTSNSDYDAAAILPQILATLDKSKITAIFANVYELGSCAYEQARCSVSSGQWIKDKLASLGVNASGFYITEFGKLNCADYDCIQTFYEQHDSIVADRVVGFALRPGQTGNAAFLHTVPVLCEYWHPVSFAVENPSKCGLQLINGIYVFPGIDDQPTPTEKRALASRYMLTCAPQIVIGGGVLNEQYVADPHGGTGQPSVSEFELTPENPNGFQSVHHPNPPFCPGNDYCVIPSVAGLLRIDHSKTTIPLYRLEGAQVPNPNNSIRRMSDFEGFFGAKYTGDNRTGAGTSNEDMLKKPLANGVSIKLTEQQAQCKQTLAFLQSVRKLCQEDQTYTRPKINGLLNRSGNPPVPASTPAPSNSRCPLDLDIPDSTYPTYMSLLSAIELQGAGNFCEQTNFTSELSKAMSKVETAMPKGFKPAYIVRTINLPQQDPTSSQATDLQHLKTWFSPGNTDDSLENKRKERVQITKVLVPANFAQDKNEQANYKLPPYEGTFLQTMRNLFTYEDQKQIQEIKEKHMNDIAARSQDVTSYVVRNPRDEVYIYCPECASTPTELESIIAARINSELEKIKSRSNEGGDLLDCNTEDLGGERAQTIKHSINPPGNPDPPKRTETQLVAHLHSKANDTNDDPQVRSYMSVHTYLLLPEEYRNVYQYEQTFLDRFLSYKEEPQSKLAGPGKETRNGITYVTTKNKAPAEAYKYLQMSGTTSFFHSEAKDAAHKIGDKLSLNPVTGVVSREPVYLQGILAFDKQHNGGVLPVPDPLVPGGKLARGLWEIMCKISQPHDSRQQVREDYPGFEEFLKNGRKSCYSGSPGSAPQTPTTSPPPTAMCIETFVSPERAQTYAAQLRTTLPTQRFASASFAGWDAYFPLPGRQHLFEQTCVDGTQICYNYILNRVTGAGINPYLAIAIALNETGGLRSTAPDGSNIKHFGCDPFGDLSTQYSNSIEDKLTCMINTFMNDRAKPADTLLREYGYANGANNQNLVKIIGILSNRQYNPSACRY